MTNIDFVGRYKTWFAISGLIIVIGIGALVFKGLNFGIEFEGGALFDVKFDKTVKVENVRRSLVPQGLGKSVIQLVGSGKEVLVKTPELSIAKQEEVKNALKKIGAVDFGIQNVGRSWGREMTQKVLIALVLALTAVLAFVAVRFEIKMGVSAVVALFHDILIAVGLYALLGREVTTATVAAFLTILGYSMYDTIVVFDRIRENALSQKRQTYTDMVNQSENQVLRRSINTSLSAIIPVFTLFLIGGETLRDFAFALLVGLVSGAYSSIFIASPMLALWKETEPRYRALRQKLAKAG